MATEIYKFLIKQGIQLNKGEFIRHHGVLGMRWGFRRRRGPSGRVTGPAQRSEDFIRAQKLRSRAGKRGEGLTNEELQALTRRLSLEKQFSELTKKNISMGRKATNKILSTAGNTALNIAMKEGTKGIEKLLRSRGA